MAFDKTPIQPQQARFAIVEAIQKNMSRALKEIPMTCWSASPRKLSMKGCHPVGCIISGKFFISHTWLLLGVSSSFFTVTFNCSVVKLPDLSGLSNKSKRLVSQSSASGKTLQVFILVLNLFLKARTLSWKLYTCVNMHKFTSNFRGLSEELRLRVPATG